MKRTFAITVAAVVFILDGTQAQECGISKDDLGKRVVNGTDATAHSWPWMVSLRYNGRHICGGSLIKVNLVVTAAHCVERDRPIGSYTVVVGSHDRTGTTQVERSYRLTDIIIHEGYHPSHLRNDIALLQLEASIDSRAEVNVVCLPNAGNRVEPGKMCYITGWGRTVGGGNAANILQEALLPVAGINACSRLYGSSVDDRTMLCAGGEGIAGGCQANSGGSFVCEENGRFVLRGVVSWGHRDCRTDHFTVFARVSSFINWINDQTGCVDNYRFCQYWTWFCRRSRLLQTNCKKTCNSC
ncbi:chymotrypsinogen A-like isoform X1 [Montipora capricornis]|uniref:chymotrypsinogen A-like isoform X1 n=1 Tax=Montipora capricornis TaxID=246305 RepID=UPI0035F15495